jgi:membrane protease YdiL (CAAX protease family)
MPSMPYPHPEEHPAGLRLEGRFAAGPPPHGWAFIDLAQLGRNTVRSYVTTLLRVILLPLAFFALAFAAIAVAAATGIMPLSSLMTVVIGVAIGGVIVAGIGLTWGVARSHRRPWLSLVSTDMALDWRRLAIGAGAEGVLVLVTLWGAHALTGEPWRGSGMSLPLLVLILLLVPFQAAAEEMLFRGYLTQALGRVVRNRGVIAAAVGIVFGAIHFNAYGPLTLPYLLILSLVFSVVSLRDERLELAIGAHTANNWFALAATDALGAAGKGAIRLDWPALALLVVHGAAFYALTRLLIRLWCERPAE